MIRLSHVSISPETAEKVKLLVLAGKIGQSEIIQEFEEAFARWLGVKHCVAVSSGTMADTIALAVLKHLNPGKTDVVVPALTFIAQVNAISYNGLNPIFVDVDADYSMNHVSVRRATNERTLCYYPVHLLGKPSNLNFLDKMPIVEDSCEAMGSRKDGKKCGSIGDLGTFSFFPSHTITTGEGGMISTNNDEYAALARRLRNHGKLSQRDFHFDVIGFNGKMTSLQAAIGLGMIKELDGIVEQRRYNYFRLGGKEDGGEYISPHAFPYICDSEEARDKKLARLTAEGIECRNLFSCIPTQEKAYEHLGYQPGDFPMAEFIGRRALYVPSHQGLDVEDMEKIKSVLNES